MAEAKNSGFPHFFADTKSAESVRRHLLEAPLDAVGPALLAASLEVGQLLSILPGALIESQKRELDRLKTAKIKNDERVALVESSIEEAEALQRLMNAGQARAQRVVAVATSREDVFHGFVSDSEFAPVAGVTVQLVGGKTARSKTSATTDADGYFSIPLETKRDTAKREGSPSFSQRINRMFDADVPSANTQADKKETLTAQVEILRKKDVIHEDPIPVSLDEGTVYREYVISEESSTAKDIDEFVSKLSVTQKVETPKGGTSKKK